MASRLLQWPITAAALALLLTACASGAGEQAPTPTPHNDRAAALEAEVYGAMASAGGAPKGVSFSVLQVHERSTEVMVELEVVQAARFGAPARSHLLFSSCAAPLAPACAEQIAREIQMFR